MNEQHPGEWKDGKKHGKGMLTWRPGLNGKFDTYTGDWIEDRRTGHGVCIYADGGRYEKRRSQVTGASSVNY